MRGLKKVQVSCRIHRIEVYAQIYFTSGIQDYTKVSYRVSCAQNYPARLACADGLSFGGISYSARSFALHSKMGNGCASVLNTHCSSGIMSWSMNIRYKYLSL